MYSWQNNLYMKFGKSLLNKQFLFPLKRKNTTWNVKPICPMLVAPSLGTSRSALLNEKNNSIKWLIRQMMEERLFISEKTCLAASTNTVWNSLKQSIPRAPYKMATGVPILESGWTWSNSKSSGCWNPSPVLGAKKKKNVKSM